MEKCIELKYSVLEDGQYVEKSLLLSPEASSEILNNISEQNFSETAIKEEIISRMIEEMNIPLSEFNDFANDIDHQANHSRFKDVDNILSIKKLEDKYIKNHGTFAIHENIITFENRFNTKASARMLANPNYEVTKALLKQSSGLGAFLDVRVMMTDGFVVNSNNDIILVRDQDLDSSDNYGLGAFVKGSNDDGHIIALKNNNVFSETLDLSNESLTTLNHELIHYMLETNTPNLNKLKPMMDKFKSLLKDSKELAKYEDAIGNNLSELITYTLTEPEFTQNLEKEAGVEFVDDIINIAMTSLNLDMSEIPKFLKVIRSEGASRVNKKAKIDKKAKTEKKANYDNPDPKSEQEEESEDDKPLFRRNVTSKPFEQQTYLPTYGKLVHNAANILRNNFEDSIQINKDGNGKTVKDYTVTFGNFIPLNESTKNKLFRLQQGDALRYKMSKVDDDGNWSVPTDYTTAYAPILYSSIGKNGKLYFAVAGAKTIGKDGGITDQGVYFLDSEKIVGFRKNLGVLKEGSSVTPKDTLKTIWTDFIASKTIDEDGNLPKDSIFMKYAIKYGDDKTFNIFNVKNNSGIYVDFRGPESEFEGQEDHKIFDMLKQGDIVKHSYKNGNKKVIDYYTPVVRTLDDIVETVIQLKDGSFVSKYIPKKYIKGAILTKENHEQDIFEDQAERLRIFSNTPFDERTGLRRISWIKKDQSGELSKKPDWNDLFFLKADIVNLGGNMESYSSWRTKTTEEGLEKMRLKDIQDPLISAYYKYYKALTRRRSQVANLKFGSFVIIDRPKMVNQNGNWVQDPNGGTSSSNAVVMSRSGDWVNLMIYKPEFADQTDENGKTSSKLLPEGGSVYFRKVKVTQDRPSVDAKGKQTYAIRALFHDNSFAESYVDNFQSAKNEFKTNFLKKKIYYEALAKKVDLNSDSAIAALQIKMGEGFTDSNSQAHFTAEEIREMSIPSILSKQDGEIYDLNYSEAGTSLKDRYELVHFEINENNETKEISEAEKLRHIARLKPGSVVLLSNDLKHIDYSSSIVVGVDDFTGLPQVGFRDKFGRLTVMPVNFDDIIGVGFDVYGSKHTNSNGEVTEIAGDEYYAGKRKRFVDDFIEDHKQLYFETEQEAIEYALKTPYLKENDVMAIKAYVTSQGKIFLNEVKANKLSEGSVKVQWTPRQKMNNWKGEGKVINDSKYWGFMTKAEIDNIPKQLLWDYLKVGDQVTKKWVNKEGQNRYSDYMIIDKSPNTMQIRTFYMNDGDWKFRDSFIFKGTDSKKPFEDVSNIKLHKDNHNYKAVANEKSQMIKGTSVERVKNNYSTSGVKMDIKSTTYKKPEYADKVNRLSELLKPKESRNMTFKSSPVELQRLKGLGDRLGSIYGKEVKYLSSDQIALQYSDNPFLERSRAFYHKGTGDIVMNTDYASMAEPIHEMGHLIMDGLKKTNLSLYMSIIEKAKQHEDFSVVKDQYPELNDEDLSVEVFLTAFGEYYSDSPEVRKTNNNFIESDKGFFNKLFKWIKRSFAKMFGIDSYKFHSLTPDQLMNLTFNDLFDSFGASMMDGKFKSEVEIANAKVQMIQNNEGAPWNRDPLYNQLLQGGVDKNTASTIWLHTKSPNFVKWAESNFNGKVYSRVGINEISSEINENSDLVFVKGLSENQTVVEDPQQIKSIFNTLEYNESKPMTGDITDYAHSIGLPMVGDYNTTSKTAKDLSNKFKDLIFVVQSVGSATFVNYYKKPSNKVIELRNKLLNNNNVKMLC